jgi:hypothetical protein
MDDKERDSAVRKDCIAAPSPSLHGTNVGKTEKQSRGRQEASRQQTEQEQLDSNRCYKQGNSGTDIPKKEQKTEEKKSRRKRHIYKSKMWRM